MLAGDVNLQSTFNGKIKVFNLGEAMKDFEY